MCRDVVNCVRYRIDEAGVHEEIYSRENGRCPSCRIIEIGSIDQKHLLLQRKNGRYIEHSNKIVADHITQHIRFRKPLHQNCDELPYQIPEEQ